MDFSVKEIATWLNGEIEGDETLRINSLSKIEEGNQGSLSFLANTKYLPYIYTTKASVVIVNADFVAEKEIKTTLIRVADSYSAFATLLNAYEAAKSQQLKGISTLSFIHPKAEVPDDSYVGEFTCISQGVKIGKNAKIYPQVFIGMNVKIGDNCTLYPGVKIYEDCIIGHDCTIHAGAVIGADGFGFAPQDDNNYKKVAQIGNVIIEDRVEIGANTTVDRATMGSTIIRRGVKLDNLIQIAHNVEVGENTVMAAQSGIAGSTKLGKNCMVGGQVAISGHLSVADGVKVAGQSGIASNIKQENQVLMGSPAFDHKAFLQSYVYVKKLPDLVKRIEELEKVIKELNKISV